MRKEQFHITGMTCSACSSRVEGCVVKLNQNVSSDAFKTVVQDAGYELTEIE